MAYSYYASITVDNTKVSGSGDHTNFPVLVSGTYDGTGTEPDLRTTANGGNIQNTDASGGASGGLTVPADLAFYNDADATTQYPHEIVSYNASTGVIVAWVLIPTLDYNDDTVFYMHYGDASVTTSQEDLSTLWADYGYVTNDLQYDSTGNGNTATTISGTTTTTGKIATSRVFDGDASDYIDVADSDTLEIGTTYTISFWLKSTENPDSTGTYFAPWYKENDYGDASHFGNIYVDGSNDRGWRQGFNYATSTSASLYYGYSTVLDTTTNVWYYYSATLSSNTITLYVDGVSPSTSYIGSYSAPVNQSGVWRFGGVIADGTWYYYQDAEMEHFRLTTSYARSADWFLTEYANQNDPSTFYTMGDETAVPAAGGGTTATLSLSSKFWGK